MTSSSSWNHSLLSNIFGGSKYQPVDYDLVTQFNSASGYSETKRYMSSGTNTNWSDTKLWSTVNLIQGSSLKIMDGVDASKLIAGSASFLVDSSPTLVSGDGSKVIYDFTIPGAALNSLLNFTISAKGYSWEDEAVYARVQVTDPSGANIYDTSFNAPSKASGSVLISIVHSSPVTSSSKTFRVTVTSQVYNQSISDVRMTPVRGIALRA
ncbi:hypothetical protein BFS86_09050 [Shewanella algae]|nr:hypothetical protein BFS86_09050 [Shewanella algae]